VLLEVKDLRVQFKTPQGIVRAANGVNFTVAEGETLGIVGESGCGKSITARAVMGLVPKAGRVVGGSIDYHFASGEVVDITSLRQTSKEIRRIRGAEIGMIFQEPMSSLSAVHTIGNQVMEAILLHESMTKKEARARAVHLLDRVGIPSPDERVDSYPFELSGGMRQRAMIAIALACNPRLLIADEPTTALDVTIQAQIIELLQELQAELGMAIIMITHNLGLVATMAHRVAVMYLGEVVEQAPISKIFSSPKHPYTQGLIGSIPLVTEPRQESLYTIEGSVPDPYTVVPGCSFHPRCPKIIRGVCEHRAPPQVALDEDRQVSCWLYADPNALAETEGAA
jgi:oligopeptide/dipeptide ABC transporter ATP-binding protein